MCVCTIMLVEHTSLACWPAFRFPVNWTVARVKGSTNPHTLYSLSGLLEAASAMGHDRSSVSWHDPSWMMPPCGSVSVRPLVGCCPVRQQGTLSRPKACSPCLVIPRMFLTQQVPRWSKTCSYKDTNAHTGIHLISACLPVSHTHCCLGHVVRSRDIILESNFSPTVGDNYHVIHTAYCAKSVTLCKHHLQADWMCRSLYEDMYSRLPSSCRIRRGTKNKGSARHAHCKWSPPNRTYSSVTS